MPFDKPKDSFRTITFTDEKPYTLDQHGFLDPPEQWDENFAEGMAQKLGIYKGLNEDHWRVIRYLRKKFIDEKTVPLVVIACVDNKLRLNKLKALFPTGFHRGACKIAGINYDFISTKNIWLTYENYYVLSHEHKLTESGFLEDFDKWNERYAELVVRERDDQKGLTDQHRKIIYFLRDYYMVNENIPTIYEMCKVQDLSVNAFMRLFPDGYRRGACRAAGLPFFG